MRATSQRVPTMGARKKIPIAILNAISIVITFSTPMPLSSSAGSSASATFCENSSAHIPRCSVSQRMITPRSSGVLRARPVYDERSARARLATVPSGRRQTTVACRGPRIMTPSITA